MSSLPLIARATSTRATPTMPPRQSSPALTSVASGAPGMLFKFVSDERGFGHFTYANEGALKVLGLSPRALISQPQRFLDLVVEDERASLLDSMRVSRESGLEWNWEGRIRVPGWQDLKWINLRATPRQLTDGRMVWDGLVQNISLAKRREATIASARDQIATLAAHQELAREDERLRLARELHDDVGGNLAGVKMQLSLLLAALPADVRSRLDAQGAALLDLVDRTIDSTRRISINLRPPTLELGLVAAIEWYLEDYTRRTGIDTMFHPPQQDIELPEQRAIGVFRICQEALNNVAKHSGAKHCEVSLEQGPEGLSLCIQDFGHGFEPADPQRADAFGLRGMQERASALGGKLAIDSAPGRGTTVTLLISRPCPKS